METLKEIMDKYSSAQFFPLLDQTFIISGDRMVYWHLKQKYSRITNNALETFNSKFNELSDMDDLLSNMVPLLLLSLENGMKEVVRDAVSMDIFTLDAGAVAYYCMEEGYFGSYIEVCEKYVEEDDEIVSSLANARAYRAARKANRARWTSVTFGGDMLDAWGNQFKAARMNAIEGVGHSIKNAVGNMIDESKANAKRKALFQNASYKKELANGLREAANNLLRIITDFLNNQCALGLGGWVNNSDARKAEAIYNNLTMDMTQTQRAVCAVEILSLDPWKDKYYTRLLNLFPDHADEIIQIARVFHIESIDDAAKIRSIISHSFCK